MTKNRSMKIAVLVLALALLTSCFIGSTFAKYTSTGTGNSAARTAVWNVTTGTGGDKVVINGNDTVTFNLFDSVSDANVKTGDDENIIAPGTEGSFALTVNNESEVNAQYQITFSAETNGVPVEFATTTEDEGNWTSTISELNVADTALNMNDSGVVTVYWRWAFNAGGVDNTHANKNVTVTATVTVSQVD